MLLRNTIDTACGYFSYFTPFTAMVFKQESKLLLLPLHHSCRHNSEFVSLHASTQVHSNKLFIKETSIKKKKKEEEKLIMIMLSLLQFSRNALSYNIAPFLPELSLLHQLPFSSLLDLSTSPTHCTLKSKYFWWSCAFSNFKWNKKLS